MSCIAKGDADGCFQITAQGWNGNGTYYVVTAKLQGSCGQSSGTVECSVEVDSQGPACARKTYSGKGQQQTFSVGPFTQPDPGGAIKVSFDWVEEEEEE
jgi:hypothetical protein